MLFSSHRSATTQCCAQQTAHYRFLAQSTLTWSHSIPGMAKSASARPTRLETVRFLVHATLVAGYLRHVEYASRPTRLHRAGDDQKRTSPHSPTHLAFHHS